MCTFALAAAVAEEAVRANRSSWRFSPLCGSLVMVRLNIMVSDVDARL